MRAPFSRRRLVRAGRNTLPARPPHRDPEHRMPLEGRRLHAPVDVRDLLRAGLDRNPEAPAILTADEQLSWRELEDRSEHLARNYAALGLRPGDRVASLMPNR